MKRASLANCGVQPRLEKIAMSYASNFSRIDRRSVIAAAFGFGALSLAPTTLNAKRAANRYGVLNSVVGNRGHTPDDFLDELIAWGKSAPDEIFIPNNNTDVYCSVTRTLGPWQNNRYRRAAMLEILRVLAGFESSWNWKAGVDITNPASVTPATIEAGAWQVSADSMNFGDDLRTLVIAKVGNTGGSQFQEAMKTDHQLAMEYAARLLRHTVNHHGPVKHHFIDAWLKRDGVKEFLNHI
jgi:hypothetical protein